MSLEGDVVERRLGCAVDGIGEVAGCHLAQTTCRRSEGHELGLLGRQKERAYGLEEQDDAEDIDLKVLEQVGDLDFVNWWEDLGDTRAGDQNVDRGDALALDFLDGGSWVSLGEAVDLDNDQRATLAGGKRLECCGCAGVAHSTDDDVVGARKVHLCEAVAQT